MPPTWICEKFSAAKTVADALFGGIASHSYPVIITNHGERLVYTSGHALELMPPAGYDAAFADWASQDVGSLVANGFRMQPAEGKADAVKAVVAEIRAATELVVATDGGREGEVIAWEMIDYAGGVKVPVMRFWTSSLEAAAIRATAANLLPASAKISHYYAGRARMRVDWLEGLTWTRYFSRNHTPKGSAVLSVGRVQSALTSLIDDRCREIASFKPVGYFEVAADLLTNAGPLRLLHQPPAEKRILVEAEARALANSITGQTAPLSVVTAPKAVKPTGFLSTSSVQKLAFSAWRWDPDFTLLGLQALYEKGFSTYPRTECAYLSSGHAETMPDLLQRLMALPEVAAVAAVHPAWFSSPVIRAGQYDDEKLTDHHAIIPTPKVPDLSSLTPNEAKLYQLIVRHTVANLLPDCQYDATVITAMLGGKPFVARGRTVKELGWRAMHAESADKDVKASRRKKASNDDDEEGQEVTLPPVQNGSPGTVKAANVLAKQTTPPAYYNKASLIDAMQNIDNYIDDPRAKAFLGGPSADRKRGLGTAAGRAEIIKKIFDRGYVTTKKDAIHMSSRGSAFVALARRLVPMMLDPIHSVDQEEMLQAIESGSGKEAAYIEQIRTETSSTLARLKTLGDRTMIAEFTGGVCPECKGQIYPAESKTGFKFVKCAACDGAFFVNDDGTPGKKLGQPAAPAATQDGSPPAAPKPRPTGPTCPDRKCKKPCWENQTRAGASYFRCSGCGAAYWPGKEPGTLGNKWPPMAKKAS